MRRLAAFLCFLVLRTSCYAQELIVPHSDDYVFGAEPSPGQPFYSTDVSFDSSTNEYTLTLPISRSTSARAFLYPRFAFCAADYIVTYEALVNGPVPTSGELRVGTFYSSRPNDAQTIVELDTFDDGDFGPHETNDNHVAVETQLGTINGGFDGKATWDTFTYAVAQPPFTIAGSEWLQVQFRNNKGDVTVDVAKGTQFLKLFAKSEYRPNTKLYLVPEASTRPTSSGYSPPLQKIRNLKIHILEGCSQLSADEALQRIGNSALNQCPVSTNAVNTLSSGLLTLRNDAVISSSTYEQAINEVENKLSYCNGLATSCPNIPTATPTPIPSATSTPTPTVTPDPDGDPFFTEDELDAFVSDVCPCLGFQTHGRYVSCVSHLLNQLLQFELIDEEMKGTFQSDAAKNSCSKPKRKRRR